MPIETLRSIFMWCTILGAGLLVLFVVLFLLTREYLQKILRDMFGLTRAQFNTITFCLLGFMEVLFWMLFFVPYLALLVIG